MSRTFRKALWVVGGGLRGRYGLLLGLPVGLIASTAQLGCDRAAALGTVNVALSLDECADYCLEALGATLYGEGDEDLPLGPALQIGCGEAVSFPLLPAGERVRVDLQGFDITGEVLLEGRSEALTIVADGVVQARVPLSPLDPPTLLAAQPDPVVVAGGEGHVTLTGSFGEALGRAGVELGGASYTGAAAVWSRGADVDAIALTLPLAASGDALVVRRCGIASEPLAVRLIGPSPGEAEVLGGPGCAGAVARAAVVVLDEVLVAWGCGEPGQGSLLRMHLDDDLCPLDPGASWALDASPTALAVLGSSAWVGTAEGLFELDLASPGVSPAAPVPSDEVRALAATQSAVYALVAAPGATPRLLRVQTGGGSEVAGLDAELVLGPLAASAETLYVAAHLASAEGRLVSVPPSGVVATYSLTDGLSHCQSPGAIAVAEDHAHVALGCADGSLAVWDAAQQRLVFLELDQPSEALAFDDPADVIFAAAAQGAALSVLDIATPAPLHMFLRPARPAERPALLVPLSRHRLLMAGATTPLTVLTPFAPAGPCAGSAP